MVNTVSGFGSTGSICTDIASVLESQGHECYIAYGQGNTSYKKNFKIGAILENHFHNLGSRLLGKQGYFSKSGTKKLVEFISNYNPDIIHLHNLHGNYLNIEILFKFLAIYNKPVIWTFHDCWAFTGKCAYYSDVQCLKWQTHCNKCPQVRKYPPSLFLDQSQVMFSDKKKWFNSVKNLTIITVSNWLKGEVEKSFFQNHSIHKIYNWVDHTVFKPIERNVRNRYGIEANKFLILGVSAGWSSNNSKLKDFVALSKIISEEMQIVLVGKTYDANAIPKNIVHIPYLNNNTDLAELYSNSDVYVHLSTEDTFGKVIAEALSCGTPAIVYNATACAEIVGDGCGYVVESRNISGVYEKIKIIKTHGKQEYAEKCRTYVLDNYNFNGNIGETINLYNTAMFNHKFD